MRAGAPCNEADLIRVGLQTGAAILARNPGRSNVEKMMTNKLRKINCEEKEEQRRTERLGERLSIERLSLPYDFDQSKGLRFKRDGKRCRADCRKRSNLRALQLFPSRLNRKPLL